MEHKRAKAGFGLRIAGTWLLIAALILSSTFSINADCYKGEQGTFVLLLLQIPEIPPSGDDAGEAGHHACHCVCQHFGGVILATCLLSWPGHPDVPLAVAEMGSPISPATPHRPPKA
jgi:hypothetical protein